MAHGIDSDGVQPQRVFDRGCNFCQHNGLQQAHDVDLLAGDVLAQAGLQPELPIREAFGQLPASQRRGLVQNPARVLEQCHMVQQLNPGRGPAGAGCCADSHTLTKGAFQVSFGSLFQVLHRMEEKGWMPAEGDHPTIIAARNITG